MSDKDNVKNLDELTQLQRDVVFNNATEQPFNNEYWQNKRPGLYVDILDGTPLFSSLDKFDSGTGWPSFTKPITPDAVLEVVDKSHGMLRTEIRSRKSNIHLGHVFADGAKAKGGLRYCINSAALKFISLEKFNISGYSEYTAAFGKVYPAEIQYEVAVIAGGCFWGIADLFSKLDGVGEVIAGYTGGTFVNPTYADVCTGNTGHAESVQVHFDIKQLSYEQILRFFFQIHDPTTVNKQGNDIGSHYRSAIFYANSSQQKIATTIVEKADKSGVFQSPVVTSLEKLEVFYKAEDYHQNYLQKHPHGYTCHKIRLEWQFD